MPAASRWSSTRLNSANTAADSPDTRQGEIVGGKRRSMNRSGGSSALKCVPAAPAARRRQKYEPGLRLCVGRRSCLEISPGQITFLEGLHRPPLSGQIWHLPV